jgi:hypothetical protein
MPVCAMDSSLVKSGCDKVVAIDGKTLRGSHDSDLLPIYLVSSFASEAGIVLGQIETQEKSNEITAIPALLDWLDVRGATVTIDAMGCPVRAVALPYKVSPAFACRMHALWRETGAVQGKAFGGLNAPGWNRMKPPQRPAGEQPVDPPQGPAELAGTRTKPKRFDLGH